MKPNKSHIFRTNLILFACFCLFSVVSPPRYDAVSQTPNVKISPSSKIIDVSQKYDSSTIIIEKKLDSLELNTKRLEQGTEKVNRTTTIMKRQGRELDKHTVLIKQIENKLKSDSLIDADKNKVDLAKKKDEVCVETNINSLPEIKVVEPERKGIFNKIFHWRRK